MRVCLMIEGQEGVTWDQWLALARAAEDAGLDALFRSDHYSAIIDPVAGALDAWATLAALAAATSTIRLGTLVSPATFRHPSVLARMAATVDHISRGRVEVGMGAGWYERDHTENGFPFLDAKSRFGLFAEQVEIVVRTWTEEGVRPRRRALHAARADGAAEARSAAAPAAHSRRHGEAARGRARRALRDRVQHARCTARRAARAPAAPRRRVRGDRARSGDARLLADDDVRDRRRSRRAWTSGSAASRRLIGTRCAQSALVGTVDELAERLAALETAGDLARHAAAPRPRRSRRGRARWASCARTDALTSIARLPRMTTIEELTGAEEVAWDLSDLYASPDDPKLEEEAAGAERDAPRSASATTARSRRSAPPSWPRRPRRSSASSRRSTARSPTRTSASPRTWPIPSAGRCSASCRSGRPRSRRACSSSGSNGPRSTTPRPRRCSPTRRWSTTGTGSSRSGGTGRTCSASRRRRSSPRSRVSGSSAWSRLYSELLSALRVTLDGEEVSTETALSRLYRPERESGEEAAAAVGAALVPGSAHARVRLQHDPPRQVDRRPAPRLPDWISSRNLSNEASDEAVQALVDAVVSRYDVPQRYYRLKARLLGLDRHRALRPLRAGGRGRRQDELGRGAPRSSSARTPTSTSEVGEIVDGFFDEELDRRARCGRTSRTARSARRPSPASTRTCS